MVANDRLRSIDRDGPYGRLEGDSQYMLTGAAMGTHSRAGVGLHTWAVGSRNRVDRDRHAQHGMLGAMMMQAKGSARRRYRAQTEGGD